MSAKKLAFFTVLLVFYIHSRFLFLSNVPLSVYWDEASIGYNAYSVLLTGADETGEVLPLHFRAFGEFKLPVYVYSTIPFIKLFGLNALAVRIPAVIFSALAIYLVYILTKRFTNRESIAMLAAFLFSIQKWFFIFSRTGYEATAGVFLFLLFIYLTHKALFKISYFPLAILALIGAAYAYNSFRLLAFIIVIPLVVYFIFRKNRARYNVFHVCLGTVLFALSLVPIYKLYTQDTGLARFAQVQSGENFVVATTKAYFSHFSPSYLFFSGDSNLRSNVGYGELYKIEFVFIVLGLIYIYKKKSWSTTLPLIFLLLAILPAAITKEYPHALRSIGAAPFFAIISAYGVYEMGRSLQKNMRMAFYALTVFLFLLSFENYVIKFFTEYPKEAAAHWQYAYRQVFEGYKGEFVRYNKVVVAPDDAQPYIFALFYTGYDPSRYREEVVYNPPSNWGFSKVERFGKFEFMEMHEYAKGTLVFSKKSTVMGKGPNDVLLYPDGSFAFNVFSI